MVVLKIVQSNNHGIRPVPIPRVHRSWDCNKGRYHVVLVPIADVEIPRDPMVVPMCRRDVVVVVESLWVARYSYDSYYYWYCDVGGDTVGDCHPSGGPHSIVLAAVAASF